MSDNLKQKTLNAIKWSVVDRFGQQAVQLIISILLARWLDVDVFGLIAMLAVFNALSFVLVDSGFGQALIRKRTNDQKELSTIFFFNLFIGISLYLILFFSAPLISNYYNTPELTKISRIVFLSIPLNALYLIPFVKLSMVLDYKSISKVNILSTAISGSIALVLALLNFGVWTLVWQLVSFHFFRFFSLFIFIRWKPTAYFSFDYIREHWKFSANLLGTSSLNAVFNNIYNFIFGKIFSSTVLGYYYQANKQAETVNYSLVTLLTTTTFNVFSQVNDDLDRLRRILISFISKSALISIPICFFLIFSAEDLIVVLIKEKWLPAVPFFQLICIANIFAPLYTLNLNALNSIGLSKNTLRIELFKKGLILLSIALLINQEALIMITAYAVISWISFFISTREIKKALNYFWIHQLKDILPSILIGIAIGIGCFAITMLDLTYLWSLILKGIIAAALYLMIIRFFYKELVFNILQRIKLVLSKK